FAGAIHGAQSGVGPESRWQHGFQASGRPVAVPGARRVCGQHADPHIGELAMKTISIVTPCFNEVENVEELYERVRAVVASFGRYRYEHIFIDNASTDGTVS